MSRLLLSVWADHTQNPNTCQPRTGLTGSTQAEDTKYRHQSRHSYSLQAASSSGAQAGIKELLFCYRYSWQPTFTLHLQCSMPESLRSTGLSERVMRFIHQRANTVQRNSNMSHIWLQALFICKPRFHHWLTCLHWLLINELQKFVMHESFIWAAVTQTAGFPRDLRTPRGCWAQSEERPPLSCITIAW